MHKIPRAAAMILMAGTLMCPLCTAQAQSNAGTRPQSHARPGPEIAKRIGTGTRAQAEDGALLREFLAKVDDPAMHERFWSDDLIYTGASGKVKTKDEIVSAVRQGVQQSKSAEAKAEGAAEKYSAEDVKIRQYGDTAVLNFRLVAQDANGERQTFRNSGTFVRNDDGQWQAVSWQATKEDAAASAQSSRTEDKRPTGKQ